MWTYVFMILVPAILCPPDKPKKPTERLEIDLKAPVVGYGIDRPPKGMSMSDWKKGKMKV